MSAGFIQLSYRIVLTMVIYNGHESQPVALCGYKDFVPSMFNIGLRSGSRQHHELDAVLQGHDHVHCAVRSGKRAAPEGLTIVIEEESVDCKPHLVR